MRSFASMHNDYLDPERYERGAGVYEEPPKRTLYKVQWHNDHASGIFDEEFTNRRRAEAWARAWKREMVSHETTAKERADARREYQWEIV